MAKKKAKAAATPALVALQRAGVPHTTHSYDHEGSASHGYGLEAAAALGVDAGRVFKTLLTTVDGRLLVAVVPVDRQLDLKALAAACGGRRAELADSVVAERVTGYVVGGISPFGQRQRQPTVVDTSALDHRTVYVSAGRRGLDVELSPDDLIRLTGATTGAIRR
jgi:Cys-tRNA(Pro)/Cys-tRNA(Cys) deacylase